MSCRCPEGGPSPNPRNASSCKICGHALAIDDARVREFFDALERASVIGKKTTMVGTLADETEQTFDHEFGYFRRLAEHREHEGRERFGQTFLGRENIHEAYEEACDLAIYPLLDSIKECVHPMEDPDLDLVLTAGHHAYLAFQALRELAGKRRGSP